MIKKIIKKFTPWMEQDKKIYKLYIKSRKWMESNNSYIAYMYAHKIYRKYKCIISPKAEIDSNLRLPHPIGTVIGAGAKIGKNVTIYQNVTIGWKYGNIQQCAEIGNNVIIYCNSTLVGDIKVGENSIIGCNSVVLRDVKDGEVVSGIVK